MINTEDCKIAVCNVINGPDGALLLCRAYAGHDNIVEFIKACYLVDVAGEKIVANTIGDILTVVGNLKNWKRHEKCKAASVGDYGGIPVKKGSPSVNFRGFNCVPFDDSLRAYVWDDGVNILKVEIHGE